MISLGIRILRGRIVLEWGGVSAIVCRYEECPRCGHVRVVEK